MQVLPRWRVLTEEKQRRKLGFDCRRRGSDFSHFANFTIEVQDFCVIKHCQDQPGISFLPRPINWLVPKDRRPMQHPPQRAGR